MPRRRPAARAQAEMNMPQRHRIAENAAVMETGRKGNAAQKACGKDAAMKAMPQRHRIAENTAVVETGRRRKAAQKTCSKGAAKKAMPQRH